MDSKPEERDDLEQVMTRLEAFARENGEDISSESASESAYVADLRRRAGTQSINEVYANDRKLTSQSDLGPGCLRADEAMQFLQDRNEAPYRVVEHVKVCSYCQRLVEAIQPAASRNERVISELANLKVDDDLAEPAIIRQTRKTFKKLDEAVLSMSSLKTVLPLTMCLVVVLLTSQMLKNQDVPGERLATVENANDWVFGAINDIKSEDFDLSTANELSRLRGFNMIEINDEQGVREGVFLWSRESGSPESNLVVLTREPATVYGANNATQVARYVRRSGDFVSPGLPGLPHPVSANGHEPNVVGEEQGIGESLVAIIRAHLMPNAMPEDSELPNAPAAPNDSDETSSRADVAAESPTSSIDD